YNQPRGIYFLQEPEGHYSNRWLTTIIVEPEETGGVTREDIRLALEKENIEADAGAKGENSHSGTGTWSEPEEGRYGFSGTGNGR
ncbi:MAG: hypothetical protein WD491_01765, partial [Balneolales bacterium]